MVRHLALEMLLGETVIVGQEHSHLLLKFLFQPKGLVGERSILADENRLQKPESPPLVPPFDPVWIDPLPPHCHSEGLDPQQTDPHELGNSDTMTP